MIQALLTICTLQLVNQAVRAEASAVGLDDARAAAAALCPASALGRNDSVQLDLSLQSAVSGRVLTCSRSRPAFLDAITLFQPSGYPPDANIVPSFIVEPAGAANPRAFTAKTPSTSVKSGRSA